MKIGEMLVEFANCFQELPQHSLIFTQCTHLQRQLFNDAILKLNFQPLNQHSFITLCASILVHLLHLREIQEFSSLQSCNVKCNDLL